MDRQMEEHNSSPLFSTGHRPFGAAAQKGRIYWTSRGLVFTFPPSLTFYWKSAAEGTMTNDSVYDDFL